MHVPPSLPQQLSLAPQGGLSLPTSKVQAEAGRAHLQAPARGFSGTGACMGRKQGRDPLRDQGAVVPPSAPLTQGKAHALKRGSYLSIHSPRLGSRPGGRWGARRRAPGSPVLVQKQRPSEALEAALGSQGPRSSPPNSQVSTQWGATSGHSGLLCWRPCPHTPGTPAWA